MKSALIALATAAMILPFAGEQPLTAPAVAPAVSTSSNVILVAQGCGTGLHRGPHGALRA